MTELQINAYFDFTFPVQTPATGACVDADALPTYRVYASGSDTVVATGNCAKRDDANTLGYYTARAQVTVAGGYAVGIDYEVRVAAIVGGVTGAAVVGGFRVVPADVARDDQVTDARMLLLDQLDVATDDTLANIIADITEEADGIYRITAAALALLNDLDAQQVRDAMQQAPTSEEWVEFGSIDAELNAILTDTATDGVVVATASKTGYALTSGERTAIIAALLATSITYPDGSTKTFEEIIEEVWATTAGDTNITGLVQQFLWPNNTTEAIAYDIDDASVPTTRTRQ